MVKFVACLAIMLSMASFAISAPQDAVTPEPAVQVAQVTLPEVNNPPADGKIIADSSHNFAFRASRIVLFGTTAADLGTTWYDLSQHKREANPLLGQSPVMQGVLVGGSVVALTFLTERLYATGHHKLATVLNFVVAGEHGFAAWHNSKN